MEAVKYTIDDLIFAGAKRQVFAIDRYDGRTVWTWEAPEGCGVTSVLVDGDRLIVAAGGYLYCVDPVYGKEVWANPLPKKGKGVTCVMSTYGRIGAGMAAEAARQQQRNIAISSATSGLGPVLALIL